MLINSDDARGKNWQDTGEIGQGSGVARVMEGDGGQLL
jgi:hypothetical protein